MAVPNWELIDFDAGTGLRKWMNYDEAGDEIQIAYDQDRSAQDAILSSNKSAQADPFDRSSDFWHAAHIPIGVMYEWKVKHGVDAWDPNHKPAVMRLLNSSDYRYLRVRNFII
jgi:hypothetical protein